MLVSRSISMAKYMYANDNRCKGLLRSQFNRIKWAKNIGESLLAPVESIKNDAVIDDLLIIIATNK